MSDDSIAAFAARVAKGRTVRNWSLREMSQKADVSPSTVMRAEQGCDLALSNAIRIAASLGLTLGDMLAAPSCTHCQDAPPAGFTCRRCGAYGPEAA